ncbi:MAG: hypothetical protein ABIJ09_24460 [Pseudomonadota bacterium]
MNTSASTLHPVAIAQHLDAIGQVTDRPLPEAGGAERRYCAPMLYRQTRSATHALLLSLALFASSTVHAAPLLTRDGGTLLYGGQPIRLVGYGCYGMLTESAFDYEAFFDELADQHGLNFARIWLNYHWTNDLTPFAGSRGNHDLLTHNQSFYARLDALARYAESKGVILQLTFFDSVMLEGGSTSGNRWINSPYRTANNQQSYCANPGCVEATSGEIWTQVHAPFMTRVVDTLKQRGNILYEIANEPYPGFFGAAFHRAAIDHLHARLSQPDVTGSRLISTNDDSLNNLSDPKVDVVSFHVNDPARANDHASLAKPVIISNDGDVSQSSTSMANSQRVPRIGSYAATAFSDGSVLGHTHLEILDKDIHGASWLSQDYNPRAGNTTAAILNVLDDHVPAPAPIDPDCVASAGSLAVGRTFTLTVDAHSGDEATTQPKSDANDGRNGDNPQFRRHNVARAHNEYWYTSSHQEAGEPSPSAEQWVDYVPDFGALGVGRYQITVRFRDSGNRASYAARYHVLDTRDGDATVAQRQDIGEGYHDIDIGTYFMCGGSFVRVQDPGAASIGFHEMKFTRVDDGAPPPPPPPPPPVDGCNGLGAGSHTAERFAGQASATGDWSSASSAASAPDGAEAQSPNLDSGEVLRVSGWGFCDPAGDEHIDRVQVSVLGRTQYQSGPYDILVALEAVGLQTSWHHTTSGWDNLDVSAARGSWSWADVNALVAEVSLHSHPGGNRDSDVWIDAFRVQVNFTTLTVDAGGTADAAQNDATFSADAAGADAGVEESDAGVALDSGPGGDAQGGADRDLPGDDAAEGTDIEPVKARQSCANDLDCADGEACLDGFCAPDIAVSGGCGCRADNTVAGWLYPALLLAFSCVVRRRR